MKNLFAGEKLIVALHIIAWIIILVFPMYMHNKYGNGDPAFVWHIYGNLLIYGALFYVNYLLLVPRLLFKSEKIKYAVSALVLIVVVSGLLLVINNEGFNNSRPESFPKERIDPGVPDIDSRPFNDREFEERRPGPPMPFKGLEYFITAVFVMGFSLGLRLIDKVAKDEKEKKELEKEKLNSELAFLKNQVSPHFFFNTLNNIYSLIYIDKENAGESVLKLSKLMRYLLYESDKGSTKLSEEITFLKNYIDLMKLRVTDKVEIRVNFPEKYKDITIPPLLFISFIENAFKHGISNRDKSFISIVLAADEDYIGFSVRNSIAKKSVVGSQDSGIGLENVKKRLNLLFPDKHRLVINEIDNEFDVDLLLELK